MIKKTESNLQTESIVNENLKMNAKSKKPLEYYYGEFDVAVIGAGHAGVEAALASARLGIKTALFTISLDAIAIMPCNPSIGGTAKGHLVREIDALGGEMAKAADANMIQSRMLNRGKGPAVHSLRAQEDRMGYHQYMKKAVENCQNLFLKQDEIVEIRQINGKVDKIVTRLGALYDVKCVIISSGTYLNGKIFVGDGEYESGPDSYLPAKGLTSSINDLGIITRRFKTGTPSRAHRRSIDFSKLEAQQGDENIIPFSFETIENNIQGKNIAECYIAYTNPKTHQIIKDNLFRSPLYSGKIEGIGPRYCPSIEDKVVRFFEKDRHQIFVEPMGLNTDEIYLQGLSSSLPEDVQLKFLRSIEGFENIEIMRNAYAIEYDCCDPTQLLPTLEFKNVKNLFGAGQFNGTSGYEEAAAQGLVAGINAALKVLNRPQLVLPRSSSYIGTLIDDLCTKGVIDPYRMMTSRSEYRLILRQDNADIRLMSVGKKIGLINSDRYEKFLLKQQNVTELINILEKTNVSPTKEINKILEKNGTQALTTGAKIADLLRRPQIKIGNLMEIVPQIKSYRWDIMEEAEIEIKYKGYITKQNIQISQAKRLEKLDIEHIEDFNIIKGLRLEAIEKLNKFRPISVGQASRISGVSPADISVMLIYLEQNKRNKNH